MKPADVSGIVNLQISSHTDSGWPLALTALALAGFLLGLTRTGQQFCGEFAQYLKPAPTLKQPVCLAKPDVLLVTATPSDQMIVATTVTPRGYNLVLAVDAAAGAELLRRHARTVGLIVIDSGLMGAGTILRAARGMSPSTRVIDLSPRHTSTDLAGSLVRTL